MIVFCPDCPTARAARALFLHDALWTHVGFTVLPLALIMLVIVIIVHRIKHHDE
jgi:hypothetical protein